MEPKAARTAKVIINFVYGFVAVLLGLRFVFRLLDANVTGFVDFLYDMTEPLIAPFQAIFDNPAAGNGSVFDSAALVAILIYGLITWGLVALVNTVTTVAEKDSSRRTVQPGDDDVQQVTTEKTTVTKQDDNQQQS